MLLLTGLAWAGSFGPKDHDGDGIEDNKDACMHRKEIINGYQDDDGCPDMLSAIEIDVYIDDAKARNAPLTVRIDDAITSYRGSMLARGLQPGTRVQAFSKVGCLDGEADFVLGPEPKRIHLNLVPHQREVLVKVEDHGLPARARIHWDGLRACGPQGPMRIQGERMLSLGIGEHTVGLGRGGREPFSFTVSADTLVVVIPAPIGSGEAKNAGPALKPVVYFGSNNTELDTAASKQIQAMVTWMNNHADKRVRVQGHADERASEGYNQKLALQRAERVRDALLQAGIAPGRLELVSRGEENPAAIGWTSSAMAKNRRVNFVAL